MRVELHFMRIQNVAAGATPRLESSNALGRANAVELGERGRLDRQVRRLAEHFHARLCSIGALFDPRRSVGGTPPRSGRDDRAPLSVLNLSCFTKNQPPLHGVGYHSKVL